eukprot:12301314-Alexandrium_andersonii.AAC.1
MPVLPAVHTRVAPRRYCAASAVPTRNAAIQPDLRERAVARVALGLIFGVRRAGGRCRLLA